MAEDNDRVTKLLAMILNCHRDPKRPAVKPSDFHPMAGGTTRRGGTRLTRGNVGMLKAFVPKGKG